MRPLVNTYLFAATYCIGYEHRDIKNQVELFAFSGQGILTFMFSFF